MGKVNDISCIINDALGRNKFCLCYYFASDSKHPHRPHTYIHIYDRWMRVKPTTNDYC